MNIGKVIIYTVGLIAAVYVIGSDPSVKNYLSKQCFPVSGEKHVFSWQCLSSNYAPSQLVDLRDRDNYLYYPHQLSKPAANAVHKMIMDAEKDGICLVVMGGYRSAKLQKEMYDSTPIEKRVGVAKPYRSEHQTGLAVDLVGCPMKDGMRDDSAERPELKGDFEDLPEYKWLLENASKYGFVQSYREDNQWITGYMPESWHWKFTAK